ncbi:hypothetical protein BD410DRAFT_800434 [Rickenella mellea]|uniref:Uncharacterized protein n=1 Tax=Rickenella mellea TaxID=50990 RepID=A0A4Y7QG31_9AGAM|nr:hypothetical protein BD410DRAFT_800434 [Rickenella mellea]
MLSLLRDNEMESLPAPNGDNMIGGAGWWRPRDKRTWVETFGQWISTNGLSSVRRETRVVGRAHDEQRGESKVKTPSEYVAGKPAREMSTTARMPMACMEQRCYLLAKVANARNSCRYSLAVTLAVTASRSHLRITARRRSLGPDPSLTSRSTHSNQLRDSPRPSHLVHRTNRRFPTFLR